MGEGLSTSILEPHIPKHHIPEHPRFVDQDYDFDLDLVYVQPRLIGMGVPASRFIISCTIT